MNNNRNIIECCNNTHRGAPHTGKQTYAPASDLGDASHVTCASLCTLCSIWRNCVIVEYLVDGCAMFQLWRGIQSSQDWRCVPAPIRFTCGVQRGVFLFRYHAKVIAQHWDCTVIIVLIEAVIVTLCSFVLLYYPACQQWVSEWVCRV